MKTLLIILVLLAGLFAYADSFYRSNDHNQFDLEGNKMLYRQLNSIQSVDSFMSYIDSIIASEQPDERFDNTISFNNHLRCAYFLLLLGHLTGNDTIYVCYAPQYTRFYPFQLDSIMDWYKNNRNRINVDSLRYLLAIQDRDFCPAVRWYFDDEHRNTFFNDSIKDSDSRNKLQRLLSIDYNWLTLSEEDSLFIDSIFNRFPKEKLLTEKIKNDSAEYIYKLMKGKWKNLQ